MSRPRGFLEDYNPRAKTRELLAQVEDVLETYAAELPLTARQIFYRLVATVDYPKTENGYERLQEHLANFRRAGIVGFDVDPRRRRHRERRWSGRARSTSSRSPSGSPARARASGSKASRNGSRCGARRPAWCRSSRVRSANTASRSTRPAASTRSR